MNSGDTSAPSTPSKETPRSGGKILRHLKRLAVGILIFSVVLLAVGAMYQAIATKLDDSSNAVLGQRIDIGGYRLHLYCRGAAGAGYPTVILEQGLGGASPSWARVQPDVARVTALADTIEPEWVGAILLRRASRTMLSRSQRICTRCSTRLARPVLMF